MSTEEEELCPICSQSMPPAELPEHTASCRGEGGPAPKPEGGNCKGGCGFFGNPDLGGFCSMCAKKGGGSGGVAPTVDAAPLPLGGSGRFGGGGGHDAPYKPGGIPTTVRSTKLCGLIVEVRKGDLVLEHVDALVNAANERLDHASGVAGAIRKYGGPAIQDISDVYFHEHGKTPEGSAIIAGSDVGKLRCKILIHAVGPVWSNGLKDDVNILRDAVYNSLMLANAAECTSVCIPAISSGIFGFPKDLCARTLFATVNQWGRDVPAGPNRHLKTVRFTNIDVETVDCMQAAIPKNKDVYAKRLNCGGVTKELVLKNGDATEESGTLVVGANQRFEVLCNLNDAVVQRIQVNVREAAQSLPPTCMQSNGLYAPGTIVTTFGNNFGGYKQIVVVVLPIYDYTEGALDNFRKACQLCIQKIDGAANKAAISTVVFELLGIRSLAFPNTHSSRMMVEEIYKFLTSAIGCSIETVIFIEGLHVAFFREQFQRINDETGAMTELPPIELPKNLEATPAAPANETPGQRRARERAAAEARLQQKLVLEQINLQQDTAIPGLTTSSSSTRGGPTIPGMKRAATPEEEKKTAVAATPLVESKEEGGGTEKKECSSNGGATTAAAAMTIKEEEPDTDDEGPACFKC